MCDTFGLSVAAWSPLGGGALSGKFTRGGAPKGSRLSLDAMDPRTRRIASEVDAVADQIGASSAQVALAWACRRSHVLPIIGARSLDQLRDNLAAADVTLPNELAAHLDEVSAINLGFPHDFIAETRPWVLGSAAL